MKKYLFLILLPVVLTGCRQAVASDPLDALVDSVYERLSLDERVAQLYGIYPNEIMVDGKLSLEKCREVIPYGVGHICQYACSLDMDADELREFVRQVQGYLMHETPAGIPAIFHDEAITGIAAKGATVYPQQLGVACSWNPALAEVKTQQTAEAMRALGAQLALSPMVDVIRTAHWPRIEESYGEDGYLSAAMGEAFVKGLQKDGYEKGIAATTKHFLGYGGANTLPWKEIYEEVLMPHEVIIRKVGTSSLMTCYDRFKDDYAVSSDTLINGILRGYLGFEGAVVSDYFSVTHSNTDGADAEYLKQCAAEAINAGNDLEFPNNDAYKYLPELLAEGRVSEEAFERAVKRALMMKARAGLLSPNPVLCADGPLDLDRPEWRRTAYELACQSVVMLKNDGVLPLAEGLKVALVGPNANTYWCMLGDYTFQSMQAFWQSNVVDPSCLEIKSLYETLSAKADVSYQRGCDWSNADEIVVAQNGDPRAKYLTTKLMESADPTDWEAALSLAAGSDVIVAALGENPALCGENRVRKGIRLPGDQELFLKELIATGKPVVLVMFGGRPQVIDEVAGGCAAILQAWYPGEEGAGAVTDILVGEVNPSAKLCVSYPRTESTELFCYNNGPDPDFVAYPFGYGLSYTSFEYSNIRVMGAARTSSKSIEIACEVRNAGERTGDEIVQLYVSPASGQALKPLQLKGFKRVSLEPGESASVVFRLSPEQLASFSDNLWTVEPGDYIFRIGPSSGDLPLKAASKLKGKARTMTHRNVYFSE